MKKSEGLKTFTYGVQSHLRDLLTSVETIISNGSLKFMNSEKLREILVKEVSFSKLCFKFSRPAFVIWSHLFHE